LHKQNGFTDTTAANTRQMTKTSYHAHTPFKSEFVRRHARSQMSVELLTDHTEHLMTQTLFICYEASLNKCMLGIWPTSRTTDRL